MKEAMVLTSYKIPTGDLAALSVLARLRGMTMSQLQREAITRELWLYAKDLAKAKNKRGK